MPAASIPLSFVEEERYLALIRATNAIATGEDCVAVSDALVTKLRDVTAFDSLHMVAFDGEGNELWRESIHLGEMTNNMAEYEALVRALRKVDNSAEAVCVYTDSLLVANQVLGKYRLKSEGLRPYLEEALRLIGALPRLTVKYIPREGNRIADKLAKDGAAKKGGRRVVAGCES